MAIKRETYTFSGYLPMLREGPGEGGEARIPFTITMKVDPRLDMKRIVEAAEKVGREWQRLVGGTAPERLTAYGEIGTPVFQFVEKH